MERGQSLQNFHKNRVIKFVKFIKVMKIAIKIENKNVEILLKKGKNVLEKVCFADERNLGEKIIPLVEDMLKRSKIGIKNIQKVEVISDQNDSYTTTRIAKTFAKTFTWGKEQI